MPPVQQRPPHLRTDAELSYCITVYAACLPIATTVEALEAGRSHIEMICDVGAA